MNVDTVRRMSVAVTPVALVCFCVSACGSSGSGPLYSLPVSGDDAGGGTFGGGDASGQGAFDVHIEQNHVTVTFVTLSCAGECALVQAVASGGNPPYSFAWDDGSTAAMRQVCPSPTSVYGVKVSDTGTKGELGHPEESVHLPLTAKVLSSCADGGALCEGGAPVTSVPGLPETLAIDTTGPVNYFAGGAALPAGRYRIEYVDGCMQYGQDIQNATQWGWTIHTGDLPINPALSGMDYSGDCVMVGASTTDVVSVVPGTTNPPPGIASYADCVSANKAMDTPIDFDFAGGKLGLFVEDGLPGDDTGGQAMGGVSPTWKLSLLSGCP